MNLNRVATQCLNPDCEATWGVTIAPESTACCEECGTLHESDEHDVYLAANFHAPEEDDHAE